MSDRLSELHARQREFAAHMRDPQKNPAPADIEERRLDIYRDLFFNNVRDFLQNGFPILYAIVGADRWQAIVRDFYSRHASQTPLFTELTQEFLLYLQNEYEPAESDPPFMLELAHYEWVEAALNIAPDAEADTGVDPAGDLLEQRPVVSPLAWVLAYNWPVHQISVDRQPAEPSAAQHYFLVYRNAEEKVVFNTLNPVSALLLQRLSEEQTHTGREVLLAIAAEIGHDNPDEVIAAGTDMLNQWRELGIIFGSIAP